MRCISGMKGNVSMSTHSSLSQRQRRAGQCTGHALSGFLVALLLSLFFISPTLASSRQELPTTQQQPQDLTRAGVSMVRLLISYSQPNQPKQGSAPAVIAQCTGLGVLVGSGVTGKNNQQVNWVLTDASLLDTGKAQCIPAHTAATLSSIEIYASSAYNSQQSTSPLATIDQAALKDAIHTQNPLALLSFNSTSIKLLPFLDLAVADPTPEAALYLTKDINTIGIPPSSISDAKQVSGFKPQIQQFLTPARKTIASQADFTSAEKEPGMPLVNSAGELAAMATADGKQVSSTDITKLLQSVDAIKNPPTNVVRDNWNKGITAYYRQQYSDAQQAFQAAALANDQFEGAQKLAETSRTAALSATATPKPTSTPASSSTSLLQDGKIEGVPIWLVSVVGLILLIAIIIIVSLIFGRSRARKKRLEDEFAQANHDATLAAQRMMEEGQQQQAWAAQQPTMQIQPGAPLMRGGDVRTSPLPPVPELRCPNCGEPVAKGATRCPHCQTWLSPSESGIHMRLKTPAPRSMADQPTLVPSGPLADQPTVEMTPSGGLNGQGDNDPTEPFGLQSWHGHNVAFAVGTRSDPGIKRRYKPNEDSLFAAQSIRVSNASPLHIGLFVIADGMGGHANGQDASRKAIQTIIDFLLPKLVKLSDLQDDLLEHLLGEGVQQANQAVHSNNMEKGADMGTTMTACLIVNTTAYVANVGDSRTYLYREGKGLRKVTNDHSVVASLVEAGIIKPDDIYTHPKRNQIYRSLGEKPIVEVDTFTVHLVPGDKFLLCSDGLWDMVRDPKIEEVIRTTTPNPGQTADALIQAALEGGGEDNVSVIVVSVQENDQQEQVPSFQLIDKPDTIQLPQL
jgi:serine/threonine protein phosphatase PrpC